MNKDTLSFSLFSPPEDCSKPICTSDDGLVEKSDLNLLKPEAAPDGSRQSHVNERKPSIGQDCDKENKVVETSPQVKKRFVLRSSRKK